MQNVDMGATDGEAMMQLSEFETLMDDALGVVDEGFDNLLALVANVNKLTKGFLQEVKTLESFRTVFVALNVFIVPVVIAVLLCYGTSNPISDNARGFEGGFQKLVMFLMLLSSCIGLPFYLIATWESYKIIGNTNEEPESKSLPDESQGPSSLFDDSLLTLLSQNSSVERLNEFARLLNDRMSQRTGSDLQRKRRAEKDSSEQRNLPETEASSSEVEMESAVTGCSDSVEPSAGKQDPHLNGAEEKPKATKFPIIYEFHVLLTEQSPNLAVRLKATNIGTRKEAPAKEEMVQQTCRQTAKPQDGAASVAGN